MKVVCIDNQKHTELEVNKIYNVEFVFFIEGEGFAEWSKNKLIIEGMSVYDWYDTSLFIKIEDWRENQLNNILNEDMYNDLVIKQKKIVLSSFS